MDLRDDVVLTPGGRGAVASDGYSFVYQGSPQCGEGTHDAPPPRAAVVAVQDCARAEFRRLVETRQLVPGHPYPVPCPMEMVDPVLSQPLRVAWFDRPLHLWCRVGQEPPSWQCVHGIAGFPFISVALSDPGRVLGLVAWEQTNQFLTWFARTDLWDGWPCESVLTACRAAGVA